MAGFEWNVSSQRVGAGCGRAQPSCKALDRGSTGVHISMARGAPPSTLGLPVSRCALCSSVLGRRAGSLVFRMPECWTDQQEGSC